MAELVRPRADSLEKRQAQPPDGGARGQTCCLRLALDIGIQPRHGDIGQAGIQPRLEAACSTPENSGLNSGDDIRSISSVISDVVH